jgi:hypothetical protein
VHESYYSLSEPAEPSIRDITEGPRCLLRGPALLFLHLCNLALVKAGFAF